MKLTPENMPDCVAADDFYRKDLTVEEQTDFISCFDDVAGIDYLLTVVAGRSLSDRSNIAMK
jgi:hypothetical protein